MVMKRVKIMGYTLRTTQTVFLARKSVRKTRDVELPGADQKRIIHLKKKLGTVFGGGRENVLMITMSSMIDATEAILVIKVRLNMLLYNDKYIIHYVP